MTGVTSSMTEATSQPAKPSSGLLKRVFGAFSSRP